MITAFIAIFSVAGVAVLEVDDYRTHKLCTSGAAFIVRNGRVVIPGFGKAKITFKCERRGGKGG